MARLLVIEGEQDRPEIPIDEIRHAGYEVLSARSGGHGLALTRAARPDLILLAWALGDQPGTEVCRALKGDPLTRAIPVMFVTARADEVDRVVGFELGASDYVAKPFSVRELLLRIRAVLRRNGVAPAGQPSVLGALRLDEEAHRAWVRSASRSEVSPRDPAQGVYQEVSLTLIEWKLLVGLYRNRGRVLSRASLVESVWGSNAGVTARTVDTHITRLRSKLGDAAGQVQTVRGIGYRFTDER
ncbi:MAG: response regulator transcription factor [Byssovorax sp.]